MNVETILNKKGRDVITVAPSTPIVEVTKVFAENGIGSIIVFEDGTLVGIVSERDVVRAVGKIGVSVLGQPVSEIMTSGVTTCSGSDTVNKIMGVMTTGRFRHVPVLEEGQLVGIISIGDVVSRHIADVELEADAMRSYIATG